jgi:hypothetical protein
MLEVFSHNPWVIVIVVIAGLAAYLMGQALAATWRPYWQVALYSTLLGCANRFLVFALYEGELLSVAGYLLDTALLVVIASAAFRLTLARQMVIQYPWLYETAGPFAWREKPGAH